MGGEKVLVGLRGLKNVQSRFGSFFGSFFAFFKPFSYRFKNVSGAVSFCTRAALTEREKKGKKDAQKKVGFLLKATAAILVISRDTCSYSTIHPEFFTN